jgi:hypothetical protein
MAGKFITADLANVIRRRSLPGVTLFNRLEGRPRAERFDRALRAEVRDPLWMLTRQWQLGEFRGDDAGSPVSAKIRTETTRLRKYRAAEHDVEPLGDDVPLEARVEQMPLPLRIGGVKGQLDIRLLLGRQWLALIAPFGAAVRDEYVAAYRIDAPDPLQPADAPICAHPEAWSAFAAVAGRRMDGAELYVYLKADPGHRASDGIGSVAGSEPQVDALGERFVAWFERLLAQPAGAAAWLPDRLEYQFACSAPEHEGEKVLTAEEYYHGHLDWQAFDVDRDDAVLGEPDPAPEPPGAVTLTTLPTQVTFNGMPNTRWRAFEDGRTNFGDVKPDTTDLAKLLLIEFALVYANDWYLVPFSVPAGSIATVRGVAVTNVFGERTWVEAAGSGDDEDWQRWAMFLLSVAGDEHVPADLSLLIPPSAQQVVEGPPLEAVALARDEMANRVWGIEQTIALPSGESKPGREAADETRAYFERDLERRLGAPPQPPEFAEGAQVRYQVMSSVPENWIPLIPVHVAGDVREIQLQRAAMLRVIDGDPDDPLPVRPRTALLRTGLDEPLPAPYLLHEEEVSRAGERVSQSFQRTRWRDGRAWVWLGVRKQTGRGESSSGLAFDRIVDPPGP